MPRSEAPWPKATRTTARTTRAASPHEHASPSKHRGCAPRIRSSSRPTTPRGARSWVFCAYRVVLAVFMGVAFVFLNRFFNFGIVVARRRWCRRSAVVHDRLARAPRAGAPARAQSRASQVTAGVIVDVVAIVMLMYASGGVRSGLGVILLVSLAAAGLITRGRLAFFHAAIAAHRGARRADVPDLAQRRGRAGFRAVGHHQRRVLRDRAACDRRSRVTRARARRSPRSARLDLANLSQINELVIRDMQDGILVVDSEGRIRQSNPRATQLLGAAAFGPRRSSSTTRRRSQALLEALAARLRDHVHAASRAARRGRAAGALRADRRRRSVAHRDLHRGRGPHARSRRRR